MKIVEWRELLRCFMDGRMDGFRDRCRGDGCAGREDELHMLYTILSYHACTEQRSKGDKDTSSSSSSSSYIILNSTILIHLLSFLFSASSFHFWTSELACNQFTFSCFFRFDFLHIYPLQIAIFLVFSLVFLICSLRVCS
jgi:hypothetical protein